MLNEYVVCMQNIGNVQWTMRIQKLTDMVYIIAVNLSYHWYFISFLLEPWYIFINLNPKNICSAKKRETIFLFFLFWYWYWSCKELFSRAILFSRKTLSTHILQTNWFGRFTREKKQEFSHICSCYTPDHIWIKALILSDIYM